MKPFTRISKAKRTRLIAKQVYPAKVKVIVAKDYLYAMPTCQMYGKKLRYKGKRVIAHSKALVQFTCNILVKPWNV